MSGEKVLLIVILVGLIALAGHAQSRFDYCKRLGQKTIGCVLQFD